MSKSLMADENDGTTLALPHLGLVTTDQDQFPVLPVRFSSVVLSARTVNTSLPCIIK